jgi:hypothetical protein
MNAQHKRMEMGLARRVADETIRLTFISDGKEIVLDTTLGHAAALAGRITCALASAPSERNDAPSYYDELTGKIKTQPAVEPMSKQMMFDALISAGNPVETAAAKAGVSVEWNPGDGKYTVKDR